MKAMLFDLFEKTPELVTVEDPSPTDDGVVIEVQATGLCRSDWHGWMGHDPDIRLPHVPGHEFAGKVVAVGKSITGFKIGDRVTVPFVSGCGRCSECHSGNQQVCPNQFQPGFTDWGSFAQYVAVKFAETNLVKLPDSIDDVTAASLGCRFATSFRAVVDQARTGPGEWVVVHGCGGVGLSAIMIATAMGANVVAVDIFENKLAFARECGAVATINSSQVTDTVEAVREITKGGAHVSMDALGSPTTCFNSIKNLRRRGRHVQVGLMVDENGAARIPMAQVIGHELEIYGSHGMQSWRYGAMMSMIEMGRIQPQKLIARRVSLEEAIPVLTSMDKSPDIGISVIDRF